MGGSTYLIPAPYNGLSSRDAHLRRRPPSGEPGTDYYMPTGTPLLAPADCVVVDVGGGIGPATGRYVTVDDGTRWLRFLHMSEWRARRGDRLRRGEGVLGISGASGYGSEFFGEPSRNAAFWRNTGGDHVHVTAFRGRGYTFGASGTIDFHALTGGAVAGGGATPFDPVQEDAEMRTIHSPNRPWANVGPGYYRMITDEAAGNTIWPKVELNDRQYDLAVEAAGAPVTTSQPGGMVVIRDNAGERPVALVGAGYYRALNDEELANVGALSDRHVVGNTRQYDLWTSMALAGQGASFPIGSVTVDVNAVIEGVVDGLSDGLPTSEIDPAQIRQAVRDALNGATISASTTP